MTPEEQPVPGTWIEIDAGAMRHNLRSLRDFVAPAELCMVVKGNAYGHGYDPVVPLAEAEGVRRFAVFSGREAAGFLQASDGGSRLMVMGHADHRNLPWMVRNGLEPWINDGHDWEELCKVLDESPVKARIHVEVETGMNRTGLPPAEAIRVAEAIHGHPHAVLEGVCTHLAGAEDHNNTFRTDVQKERFDAVLATLAERGIHPPTVHMASSAAALREPATRRDMVRVGIAAYGLWPSPEIRSFVESSTDLRLRRVLRWRSQIMAVREVTEGDYVGYGTTYQAETDIRVAVVPVGYSDGFTRQLSNRGFVLIRGHRCPILGNVNMNMVQVRVDHVPEVAAGDEVILIGRQGDEEISVASFSDFNNVVNYELMSRLCMEIPRMVVDDTTDVPPVTD